MSRVGPATSVSSDSPILVATSSDGCRTPSSPSISSDDSSSSPSNVDQEWAENVRQLHLLKCDQLPGNLSKGPSL
ncbi:hypothetical protein O181_009045 [Austropuccinia psidii MF-1]|uniref:Uncharacterized protein n=1 Tax=Austropuccinia psidii MF-1 TaxID=1389203 RepID=A0A9Q3GJH7_9BASI|nr:hypothetical protein [Austropuccinia psidii MF-1]